MMLPYLASNLGRTFSISLICLKFSKSQFLNGYAPAVMRASALTLSSILLQKSASQRVRLWLFSNMMLPGTCLDAYMKGSLKTAATNDLKLSLELLENQRRKVSTFNPELICNVLL